MSKIQINWDLRDRLPDGPLQIHNGPYFEYRRMSKRDIEFLCSQGEREPTERMADRSHESGMGLSREDWEQCPETYRAYCHKGCYCKESRRKGHVVEFGVRGVYICEGCDYAYPPINDPEETME